MTVILEWMLATLRRAFWAPALVLLFWAVAAKGFAAYIRFPWLDIPTHLLGGAASAYFFAVAIDNLRPILGDVHPVFRGALSFGLVALTAILWEFAEYASDLILGSHLNLGVEDTLHDLFFGLLGGFVAAAVGLTQRLRTDVPRSVASGS